MAQMGAALWPLRLVAAPDLTPAAVHHAALGEQLHPSPVPGRGALGPVPVKVARSSSQSPDAGAGAVWLKMLTYPPRIAWCSRGRRIFWQAVPSTAAAG